MAEKNIKCPHCNSELSLDEEYMGVEVTCPVCNQNFVAELPVPVVKVASDTESADSQESLGSMMKKFARNTAKNAAPIMQRLAEKGKNFAKEKLSGEGEYDNFNSAGEYDENKEMLAQYRYELAKFFAKANAVKNIGGGLSVAISFFLEFAIIPLLIIDAILKLFYNPTARILAFFRQVQQTDQQHLENLDVLPRYGKNTSQLVAPEQTLFSPAIGYGMDDDNESGSDGPIFKFAVSSNEKVFMYSLEEFVKLYIFEDQLFVFKAYWDYTTGELFSESSEAFFFKDISNISTQSSYEYVKRKLSWHEFWMQKKAAIMLLGLLSFIGLFILSVSLTDRVSFIAAFSYFFLPVVFIFSLILFIMYNCSSKKSLIKRLETFSISASSGNSIGVTILCDEWIEAKEGKVTQRNSSEKIIQSIRKMIEEKKVDADA